MRLLSVLIAAILVPIAAIPVQAYSASVPATILKSYCTSRSSPIHWRGGMNNWNTYQLPHGTVVLCYTKYKLQDNDSGGDYYSMTVTSEWTTDPATFYDNDPAKMSQYATSNTTSKDNVYGWTKAFTSTVSCSTPFTVGLSVGILGVSTTPEFCSGYGVTLSGTGSRSATWNSTYAAKIQEVETTFTQKVANGVVPKFSVGFKVPYYIYTYNSGTYYVTADYNNYNYTGI